MAGNSSAVPTLAPREGLASKGIVWDRKGLPQLLSVKIDADRLEEHLRPWQGIGKSVMPGTAKSFRWPQRGHEMGITSSSYAEGRESLRVGVGTWVSTCHSTARVWFFHRDLQGRQTSQPPVEDSHNRCLARATCGAGRLFLLHTSSREQTNIFHWACHPFVKAQHVSGEAFIALFYKICKICVHASQSEFMGTCVSIFVYQSI